MVAVSGRQVEFTFFRPDARQVRVVGDFNNWTTDGPTMDRDERGYWRLRMELPPGEFRFRYRADGRWYTDYAAFGVEHGPYGLNSVLLVKA